MRKPDAATHGSMFEQADAAGQGLSLALKYPASKPDLPRRDHRFDHTAPLFIEPFGGDRISGTKFLRKQGDPKLFDHPAQLPQFCIVKS